MLRWVWLFLAAVSTGALAFGSYTLGLMLNAKPIKPTAAGQELINGFDVVSVQLNILTLAITVMGIGLAVAAVFGYQTMREASENAARETARKKADEVATNAVAEHIEKLEAWKRGFAPSQDGNADPGQAVEMSGDESDGGPTGSRGGDQEAPA